MWYTFLVRRQAIPLKKIIFLPLVLILLLILVSCGEKGTNNAANSDTGSGNNGEETEFYFDTDVSGYDPYAIVDYENALVDAACEGEVHIPKINVYLKGACALSEKIMNDYKALLENADASVTYECIEQYDTLQIMMKTVSGGKESYRVYYYDALTDNELGITDFISYCSVAFKDVFEAAVKASGNDDLDEDALEYIVYHGGNDYDIYVENNVYRVNVEKTEIDPGEIIDAVGTEYLG